MQIRFIPCLIFHIYKSEKSGGWVGMVGGGGNIARGVKQDIAKSDELKTKVGFPSQVKSKFYSRPPNRGYVKYTNIVTQIHAWQLMDIKVA